MNERMEKQRWISKKKMLGGVFFFGQGHRPRTLRLYISGQITNDGAQAETGIVRPFGRDVYPTQSSVSMKTIVGKVVFLLFHWATTSQDKALGLNCQA